MHSSKCLSVIKLWRLFLITILFLNMPMLLFSQSTVRINEFMASNRTGITDEDGDTSDWIEIYNPTSAAIDLNDWIFTDDLEDLEKWTFPDISIDANEFLLVFASGKDRSAADAELHTNFKISADGEYLALMNSEGVVATEFDPGFPAQITDVSFGYMDGDYVALATPTPGAENLSSEHQYLPEPVFSKKRGFYDDPFSVELSVDLQNADIYYTLDGDEPSSENGIKYIEPIQITTTTVLRAITVKLENMRSRIATQTYLFLDDVINQPNDPDGYPAEWGPYAQMQGNAIADYEMDPEITQDTEYSDKLRDALLQIPTISLVFDKDNFFSNVEDEETGGIYIFTGPPVGRLPGKGWERPASFEFFNEDSSENVQVNCGVRLQGGHSRLAEKSPKHSFRLVFRTKYGPAKLNYPLFGSDAAQEINTVTLRAGFCNAWHHHAVDQRERTQYIRDLWAKDTQLDMGHLSGRGDFAHVYINGLYWGVYNYTERMDKDFAASYMVGNEEDFDVIKDYAESGLESPVVDGEVTAWHEMMNMASEGLADAASYHKIQGNNPDGTRNPNYEPYVDMVNYVDYMILNLYGGNTDWDHHNWAAIRNRENPEKGFQFFCWDSEHILEYIDLLYLGNNAYCPSQLFMSLVENAEFRRLFVDRIQLHCYNGGALTPDAAIARWMKRANEIDLAIIAESARWGDYRRDVHQNQPQGPFDLYTKNDHWLPAQSFLINSYFPNRTTVFVDQLKQIGIFPDISVPVFKVNDYDVGSSSITAGDVLTMESTTGTIYYTLDGSDPYLIESLTIGNDIEIVSETADKKVLVPSDNISLMWRYKTDFDDSEWLDCSGAPGGIGYEKGNGYQDQISLDVGNQMHEDGGGNPNTSCYVRIKFDLSLEDLQKYSKLMLGVRYDDGFLAYLNGVRVAQANGDLSPSWNSSASQSHEADSVEFFDITSYRNKLNVGVNVLAIHAMNIDVTDSDFIINATLLSNELIVNGGGVSPEAIAYSSPITLNHSAHIKARTLSDTTWSAMNEAILSVPDDIYNLKVTEIHYHPLTDTTMNDQELEFIELKNTGSSPIDLSGISFCNGIDYKFPLRSVVKAGGFIVLAANETGFAKRYGFYPFGQYKGFLNNGGERIALIDVQKDTIFNVRYDDNNPWPESADGEGRSLVPVELDPSGDQNNVEVWRASLDVHGSPGRDDVDNTHVNNSKVQSVAHFKLHQNYPNPFNPITRISYELCENAFVRLDIYNIKGQKVKSLVHTRQNAGRYNIDFNASNLASGVYFYKLQAGRYNMIRRMVLMK